MDIVITDVTEMHGDNYCVAGWDAAQGRMVRPLPNGSNWQGKLVAETGVRPGATIRVAAIGAQPSGSYPHRTEDTVIDPSKVTQVSRGPVPWFGVGAPPAAVTLSAAFQHRIETTGVWDGAKKGAHVKDGTQIGSLAAVKVGRANLEFFENDFRGEKSLRAYLADGEARYNLPVVARNLQEAYRAGGIDAVNKLLPKKGDLHVRVGLARAWKEQPDKCTVMINGVHW